MRALVKRGLANEVKFHAERREIIDLFLQNLSFSRERGVPPLDYYGLLAVLARKHGFGGGLRPYASALQLLSRYTPYLDARVFKRGVEGALVTAVRSGLPEKVESVLLENKRASTTTEIAKAVRRSFQVKCRDVEVNSALGLLEASGRAWKLGKVSKSGGPYLWFSPENAGAGLKAFKRSTRARIIQFLFDHPEGVLKHELAREVGVVLGRNLNPHLDFLAWAGAVSYEEAPHKTVRFFLSKKEREHYAAMKREERVDSSFARLLAGETIPTLSLSSFFDAQDFLRFARVKELAAQGLSVYAIARKTGLPYTTAHGWLNGITHPFGRKTPEEVRRITSFLPQRQRLFLKRETANWLKKRSRSRR
jgi:hypothetical protein